MSTFSNIAKGTRAVKVVDFPLENTRCALLPDLPELAEQRQKDADAGHSAVLDSPPVKVGLRVLNGSEQSHVLEGAKKFAQDRGVSEAKAGDPLYDLGYMVETLALCCVDPDSPENARTLFFDGGTDQILEHLDQDRIAFLYERHQHWQDACAPQALTLSPEQFYAHMLAIAVSEDEAPFFLLRPATRWSCMRTTAALYLSSLKPKSDSTLASDPIGTLSTRRLFEMAAFSELVRSLEIQPKPRRVVVLEPKAFTEDTQKPTAPVAIGIRVLAEGDAQGCRIYAEESTKDLHEDRENFIASYNDALIRMAVARGTTDPNDAKKAFFQLGEDEVKQSLTIDGVKRLYDEIETLTIEESVLLAPAGEADCVELSERLLDNDLWANLAPWKAKKLLRLVTYFLEQMDA